MVIFEGGGIVVVGIEVTVTDELDVGIEVTVVEEVVVVDDGTLSVKFACELKLKTEPFVKRSTHLPGIGLLKLFTYATELPGNILNVCEAPAIPIIIQQSNILKVVLFIWSTNL